MTLPPARQAELQRYMDSIARELLRERLDRDAADAAAAGDDALTMAPAEDADRIAPGPRAVNARRSRP